MNIASVSMAAQMKVGGGYQHWLEAMQGEKQVWLFIAKALLALYLSCWIAMRLEMPSPATAMITVLIVMNPQTGMVLAKAFYRGMGTLIGCIAGVVMVGLFPQQPLLLLLVMALWSGGMAAGALLNRNMRAYSFVLGGYTVAMIVLPSVNNPAGVFDTAIWRLVEVGLGLIVASCVFDIVLPTRLRNPLRKAATDNCEQFLDLVCNSCRNGLQDHSAIEASQQALVRGAVSYEDLRSVAIFDDPSIRASSSALTQLNQRFMTAVSRFHSLHHFVMRLQRGNNSPTANVLTSHLLPLGEKLSDAELRAHLPDLQQALQCWREKLEHELKTAGASLPDAAQENYEMGVSLLLRFVSDFLTYLALRCSLDVDSPHRLQRHERQVAPFMRATDPMSVLLTMLRAGGVMFAIGLLWMMSGWSNGGTALFGIVALLSMLSAVPNPVAVTRLVALGHLAAPVLGLACYSLLPLLNTFPLLVLGTLPFMIIILYIGTRPALAPFGMALNMGFMVALMIPLAPTIDAQRYLNEAVAISVGVIIALLSFLVVPSVTGSRGQLRRMMRLMRWQVRQAARLPLRGLAEKFESRNRDIMLQVNNMTRPGSLPARRMQEWTLLVHETGQTIIDLRKSIRFGNFPRAVQHSVTQVIHTLGSLYGSPAPRVWHQARQQLDECLEQVPAGNPVNTPLRQLLLQLASALDDGDSVLARSAKPQLARGVE